MPSSSPRWPMLGRVPRKSASSTPSSSHRHLENSPRHTRTPFQKGQFLIFSTLELRRKTWKPALALVCRTNLTFSSKYVRRPALASRPLSSKSKEIHLPKRDGIVIPQRCEHCRTLPRTDSFVRPALSGSVRPALQGQARQVAHHKFCGLGLASTRLATDQDGLVRGLSPCECGAHLAVGLVGHGEAVGRRLWCAFGVRGSQCSCISLCIYSIITV